MLKKIGSGALIGSTIALSLCTPTLAAGLNELNTTNINEFKEPVEIDKILAEGEVTVYENTDMEKTSGKLFNDNIADVVIEHDNMLEIQSGKLHGYVKKEDVKLKHEAKNEILEKEVKAVVKNDTHATVVASETDDLLKTYTPEKDVTHIKEGEEYTVKNYGNNVFIEKDNKLLAVDPEVVEIDYQRTEGKTDEVIAVEKKEKEDTEAANAVMDIFYNISDDVTVSDKEDIESARLAYNNLTADQKKKITNLDTLEKSEEELKEEIEKERIEEEKKREEALKKENEEASLNNEETDAEISYDVDTTGWATGIASAYGGHSDANIISNQRTATGDAVTETSMGVAVPMAWSGFRSLYGHKVLISYGGKTVTATINDCGGMGNGSRALDLQPGVFRAFGFTNCNDWGLREVKYKIL